MECRNNTDYFRSTEALLQLTRGGPVTQYDAINLVTIVSSDDTMQLPERMWFNQ